MSRINVLVRKLNRELLETHFDEYKASLYPERQLRISKLKLREPAYASMVAGKLLQDVVKEQLGIASENLTLVKTEYGKPYVKGCKEFHFNLSHSGDYVIFAYGDIPMGVDVERLKDMDIRVAKRCYTDEEYNRVVNAPEKMNRQKAANQEKIEDKDTVFYRIWTMKEAYLKLTGQGISVPLNSFEVDLEQMKVKETTYKFDGCYVDDYYISICYDKNIESDVCIEYSVQEDWNWNTISKMC